MSLLFYILGLVSIVAGGGWAFLIFTNAASEGAGLTLGAAMAMTPGFSLAFAGFVFLALSGILYSLKRIARNTGDAADTLDELLAQSKRTE